MENEIVTAEQLAEGKQFYDRNGYLAVPVLEPKECDGLLRLLEKYADKDFSAEMNLDRKVPELKALMRDKRIVSIIRTLQNNSVIGTLISQILFKKAGTVYANQAWEPHQDNSYPQAPYGAMLTVNIFLEDADRENGCMYVCPRSHAYNKELLPFVPTPSYKEKSSDNQDGSGSNPGNRVEIPPGYQKRDVIVKKGTLLVMHGHMIHGSYANTSTNRSRPLFSITYCNKNASFLKGKNAKREWEPVE
ncbi:MAG: hypothetical protein A2817_03315 [Candidatus Yanofskybacteria bacterium RIFCSPHIGHO2_01_FULL_39_8b]|uniref:Phytanoyl-CoA dioxygenase n=1 Tax=Candidatus Yanofskybacteria bacterium RIFCSPHIGHO2_01_FULL_39_8b TaxID=1802659 RepID=A0A1F8EEV2_9BACT|nr:MAG: hypothetical protein A2817_03315 [Candidatus Yanofskybacteria bacterium RIFCSPHIGHO2_01_FULL_39_8b]